MRWLKSWATLTAYGRLPDTSSLRYLMASSSRPASRAASILIQTWMSKGFYLVSFCRRRRRPMPGLCHNWTGCQVLEFPAAPDALQSVPLLPKLDGLASAGASETSPELLELLLGDL